MSGRYSSHPMLVNLLTLFALSCLVSSNQSADEAPQQQSATNVRVNIPNFLNFIPNIEKVVTDHLKSGIEKSRQDEGSLNKHETPLSSALEQSMENYGKIREVLSSALGGQGSDLFSLDFKKVGEKTKLEASMPFAGISINARTKESKSRDQYSSTESPGEASTEVPFQEYLGNLLKHQGKALGDVDVSVRVGEDSQAQSAAEGSQLSQGERIEVDVTTRRRKSSRIPIKSRNRVVRKSDAANLNDLSKFGDTEMEVEKFEALSQEDSYDPEVEYRQQMEDQTRQYFEVMGYNTEMPNEVEESQMYTEAPAYDNEIPQEMEPGRPIFVEQKDPVKRMAEYYYVQRNLRAGEQEEPEVYAEYIDDIEGVTGHLSEDSKSKLRYAFQQFKTSLDDVEFGDNIDLNQILESEQKSHNYWLPRRVIDQRDLEIAFTNIDSSIRPNPGDRMILAFTLTGVPLKIYMDGEIENPVGYLHQVLNDAGVTLNVPVNSFDDMEPFGGEVLYVGAGNKGKQVTEAVSLMVPRVEDIKKYVSRFLRQRRYDPNIGQDISGDGLAESLHESLASSQQVNFSDTLLENYRRNPVQVIVDIVNFLNQSQNNVDGGDDEENLPEVEVEIQEEIQVPA